MLKATISAWMRQVRRFSAMDLALDTTEMTTYAYADDAQGLADFVADASCALDAVLNLRDLVPAHVHLDLDHALDEINCAMTGELAIDDRLHDMINANAAVKRANRALLRNSSVCREDAEVASV